MLFWKIHALGNHFVFIMAEQDSDHAELARKLCNPRTSVGADGLLSIVVSSDPPLVRMWNPDGSEDFCGNGLSCAAHLLHFTGRPVPSVLQTPARTVKVDLTPMDRLRSKVRVAIPQGTLDWRRIPLDLAHGQTDGLYTRFMIGDQRVETISLNNGNMHSVLHVDQLPTDADFARLGPLIETHPIFPYRTNVVWCVAAPQGLILRIWERGVGETYSCGTGAAAAVQASHLAVRIEANPVTVEMPGGSAEVSLESDCVMLTTIAEIAFSGDLFDQQ